MAAPMHTALQSVVKYFNSKKESRYVNDVRLSQLQHKVIFGALVACAILSGLTNWYSKIDCAVSDSNLIIKRYIEEWCYANSTFLVVDTNDDFVMGNQYSDRLFHVKYYQWVTLALLVQAACFQIPRLLWKFFEGGCISKIFSNLAEQDFAEGQARSEAIRKCAKYYVDHRREGVYKHYFMYFALGQCLYVLNAVAQICFVQIFLGYEFLELLPSFVQGSSTWNKAFPKRVKCNCLVYGPTGAIQTLDVLCVLAMNVLFEKLYLFVWIALGVSVSVAIAQTLFLFEYMSTPSTKKASRNELDGPSSRLILKFLKSSLDQLIYEELVDAIDTYEAQIV